MTIRNFMLFNKWDRMAILVMENFGDSKSVEV